MVIYRYIKKLIPFVIYINVIISYMTFMSKSLPIIKPVDNRMLFIIANVLSGHNCIVCKNPHLRIFTYNTIIST